MSKLSNKIRFTILNDTTHEELFVFRTNGRLFILTIILSIVFLITSVILLISFTSLREFIPGYPNAQTRRTLVQNALKIDSLQNEINLWGLQLVNIQRVMQNEKPINIDSLINVSKTSSDGIDTTVANIKELREGDSLLRVQILKNEQFSVASPSKKIEQLEGMHFFIPVQGVVTEDYNLGINHPYLDIAAEKNSVVSSVLDGTVIISGWDDNNGYVLYIQHDNNIISGYKHNGKLLKKVGEKVLAGTPVALVGNTGKITTSSHLHFELWYKGEPVNPSLYIKF